MNKSDLITDARRQITLAKIHLEDGWEKAALENLRSALLQIARFTKLLRKPKRTANVVAKNRGVVVSPAQRRSLRTAKSRTP